MLMYISQIILTAILIIDCTNAVPLSDFISFGQTGGDSQFSKVHRSVSSVIPIPPRIPYFNEIYSNTYVSSHGYVSFDGPTAYTTPVGFPFKHPQLSLIYPFWANVDQSVSGTTNYRSINSSSQIDKEIRKYFIYAKDFTTKWALIATWDKVGYYNRHADKVNTFQVVVATNGSQSYAIFNYLDNGIQWSSADSTGGVNGIGPNGAQVGFNGGDGVHFFSRPETQSDSILQLDDNSNVCVPGKYVFRIDGETIQPGRCVNIKPDTCTEEVYSDMSPKLIVSNVSNIVSVDLDTTVVDQYGGIHCYTAFGVEYDLVNRVIYWSEVALGLIRRVSFDNSFNGSAVETIVTGLSRPEQIAVDWVNRKLYWTDHGRYVIECSDLDGRNIELIASGIIPQAIAIDPFHKTIFWTNLHTRTIERAPMTRRYKYTIANVVQPSGLTIDYDNNLLYWTDHHFNQILSCDSGGNNIKIIPVSITITNPYAITVFQSNLYWTDRSNSHIHVANQFTGRNEGNISASLNQPTDINVLDSSRQPGALYPFIIEDTFIHCITVLAPESFTISVEFVAICMHFNITWEFNGNLISNDSNHVTVNSDLSNSRHKTSIKILQSSKRDAGTYTVTVTSVTGNDSVNIAVKILSECTESVTQTAFLLFNVINSIQRINLDGSDKRTVVSNVFNIRGLDFDILTNTVYWCEINEGNIYRANIDSDGRELIVSGLIAPKEVAVDWINRKLYWSDSGSRTIQYSNLDGSGRRLFLINIANQPFAFVIEQPHALAIDPFSGHIYWTNWGRIPKIEKLTLTGRNRHIIISSNIVQPSGLTIDYAASKLYWVDASLGKIETSDLEGRGRRVLFTVPQPYGIAVYNGILYWTDWMTRSVASASIDGSTALRNITSGNRPSNVHVVHHSRQLGALYPHIIKDRFIQHVKVQAPECFTLSVEFISACDNISVTWQFNGKHITNNVDNYMINFNNIKKSQYKASLQVKQSSENYAGTYTVIVTSTTGSDSVNISVRIINDCTLPALQDAYLLFTDYYSIQRVNLDGSGQHTEVSNLYIVHALDFDILTNTIYWSELSQGNIYRASLDSSNSGRELIVSGLRLPENVVVDWINRKLYWCDDGSNTIEYSKLDGSGRMVLLDNGIDRPRGLAIDPFSGYIYWTDWGATPKIERIKLSDSTTEIIIGSGIVWPSSLTIDYESLRLYWADAPLDKIEVSNLDGSERATLYSRPSVLQPYGISIYNGILYWTDWTTRSVISASTDGHTLRNITFGIRPSGIHVVHHSKQPGACGGNCSCLDKNPYILINNNTAVEKRILVGNRTYSWENLIKSKSKPLGFDVDIATCTLFWSTGRKNRDVRLGKIYASSLIDSNSGILHSGLGYPIEIAVNWITRKLYWSDTVLSTIEYSGLDGTNRQVLLSNVNRVEAIAVDPHVNDIYWVSFQAGKYAIEKMKLDGTDRHIIVSNNLRAPNSLVIDFAASRLYWTDIKKIVTSNLEGDDRFTIYTTVSRRPTALSLYNNELFWAEWVFEKIVTYTPDDGNGPNTFVDKVTRTETIQVVHKSRKPRSCYDTYAANDTVPL